MDGAVDDEWKELDWLYSYIAYHNQQMTILHAGDCTCAITAIQCMQVRSAFDPVGS